jgi:hypothetical protein
MGTRRVLGGGHRIVHSVTTGLAVIFTLQACGTPANVGGVTRPSTSTASSSARLATPTPIASNNPGCMSQNRPAARSDASMAWLSGLDQAVLFGGWSSSAVAYFGDTWTWHAGCWTPNPVSRSPSPRQSMAMAYDPVRKVVVAFGGRTNPGMAVFSSETWLWDGKAWTRAAIRPALSFSWAAFDENLQRVLLYGEGPDGVGQTWMWNGAQWNAVEGPSPSDRSGAAMAFDPASQRVLLFGGLDDQAMKLINETWAWNGSTWSKLAPIHSPSPRQTVAMAPFAAKNEIVLVGGNGRDDVPADAWIWNGSDWSQTGGVGARLEATAIDIGSAVLLFGGGDLSGERNDVELWNGSTWTTR